MILGPTVARPGRGREVLGSVDQALTCPGWPSPRRRWTGHPRKPESDLRPGGSDARAAVRHEVAGLGLGPWLRGVEARRTAVERPGARTPGRASSPATTSILQTRSTHRVTASSP